MSRILVREILLIVVVAVAAYFSPAALLFGGSPGTFALTAAFMVLPITASYAIASALVNRGRKAPTWLWWALGLALYAVTFFKLLTGLTGGNPDLLAVTPWLRFIQVAPLVLPWVLVLIAALMAPRSQWVRVAGRTLLLYALPLAVTRFLLSPIVAPVGTPALLLSMNVTTVYLLLRILSGLIWPLPVDREAQV